MKYQFIQQQNTKCICPKGTHYLFSGGTECFERTEFTYRVKATSKNCIPDISAEIFNNDSTGIIDFKYPMGPSGVLMTWGGSEHHSINFFANENSLIKLADGRYEFKFKSGIIVRDDCPMWENKAKSTTIYCYGHGLTNVENTKMDIEMIYIDRIGNTLDTGYLYLWKD